MAGERVEFTRGVAAPAGMAQQLTMAAAQHFSVILAELRSEMIDEVNKVIREELVTDRDSQRRKRYQRHLLGSIDVVVSANRSNFPLKIKVTSKAEKRKVAALEYGSPGHLITPKNGEWLYFPYNPGGNAHANAYQARRAPGSPKIGPRGGTKSKAFLAKTYTVEHPGNRPYHFMRRGVERVIQRRLR